MLKFVIFVSLFAMCLCQNEMRKKKHDHDYHHNHHHLLYSGFFYYLAFIAIKVKVVFLLGTIFVFMLFAGKLFAIIKYAESAKYQHHDDHHEKIIVQSPSNHDFAPPSHSYDGLSTYSGTTLDHPPPGAHLSGEGYDSPPPNHRYGRSQKANNLLNSFNVFMNKIRRMNITEMAFDKMKINSTECRMKFVCQSDYYVKNSYILSSLSDLLSDDLFDSYKTKNIVKTISDCGKLYPDCNQSMSM